MRPMMPHLPSSAALPFVLLVAALMPEEALAAQDGTTPIRLPQDPVISPDGDHIAFAWGGDLWTAAVEGGKATRLTVHPARDSAPRFHPDGETVFFSSNRDGNTQIFSIPMEGGAPRQVTFDSNSKTLCHVTSDGENLLVRQGTDRGWHYSERDRLMLIDIDGESPKEMLFDAGVRAGALSPDGQHALFCRGRSNWNRKGYQGPQAMQLWHADLSGEEPALRRLGEDRERFQNVAAMDPMWGPDGETAYYISDPDGTFNIYKMKVATGEVSQVTDVGKEDSSDDGAVFPSITADGRTILFRRRFDLATVDTKSGEMTPIELFAEGDGVAGPVERVTGQNANRVAFTPDGKQIAFACEGDIWVMDRILKEPVRVTSGEHLESSLVFSADGTRLFYVTDAGGEADIWEATHSQEDGIWWLAKEFNLRQVTDDADVESSLTRSPKVHGEGDSKKGHIGYVRGTDIFVMDDDGNDQRLVASMWSSPSFSWSPDGRWMTYATQDDNYNSDVYIVPLDGTREPFNLSRHPDRDGSPAWSGDGKRIAWVGRRDGDEADIYWIELTKESDEATERDETLEKALKAMESKDKKKGKGDKKKDKGEASDDAKAEEDTKEKKDEKKDDLVKIDFEGIFDRTGRIRISDSFEGSLIWFGKEGSTLGFTAQIDGSNAFMKVDFPRPGTPKRIAGSPLRQQEWLTATKEFAGLTGGKPSVMTDSGKTESFGFRVQTAKDWRQIRRIAFDQAWRAMRDRFYDEDYNNRDWSLVRAKYRDVAAECLGAPEFSQLCNMMLGELNASHMGHSGGRDPLPDFSPANQWSPRTMHLGLRFDAKSPGPGLMVESVIPGSPCAQERSHVAAGETLLSIDGTAVGPDVDVERVLTMDAARDVTLRVKGANGEERDVTVRPTTSVAGLLYDEWVEKTRAQVEELSEGRLGYLHIRGMNFTSFRQMEEDLYHAGAGKDGLLIDVRFNGGGSTTDHVLTALTQPVHAITQSRGSGEGYPQDRKIYASWSKPIVLLCNEHSFSNAEILSHAIKHIGRGRLVGMRTAGGVISTGGQSLMDGGFIRMPTRGWYLVGTGEDMELNGCEPDFAFWNDPMWNSPGGSDGQLVKAVEVLTEDVQTEAAKPKVKLVPAARLRR